MMINLATLFRLRDTEENNQSPSEHLRFTEAMKALT